MCPASEPSSISRLRGSTVIAVSTPLKASLLSRVDENEACSPMAVCTPIRLAVVPEISSEWYTLRQCAGSEGPFIRQRRAPLSEFQAATLWSREELTMVEPGAVANCSTSPSWPFHDDRIIPVRMSSRDSNPDAWPTATWLPDAVVQMHLIRPPPEFATWNTQFKTAG